MSKPASRGAKVLRVGVIRDGKITEERQIRHPSSVSVGQDGTNTFVIPASELPASFPVFEYRNGQYTLLFTDRMNGRVANRSGDFDFAGLKSKRLVQKRGSVWALALDESAKGKVSLGEVTLLFQFVSPPPEPARIELPPEVRGTVWRSIDHLFFGILAASLFLHFAGAACIMLSPKPADADLSLDELPDRFARVLLPPKPPEPEQKAPEQTAQPEEKKDTKKDVKKKELPADATARKAMLQQKVAGKGLLKILGSAGGSGALSDVLGSGTGSGDVASALAGARGVSIATADSVGARAGGGSGRTAGIGDVGTSGGGKVALAGKGDVKVSGQVSAAAPEVDSADVDRAALSRYIRDRLGAIRGCYERELKRNPGLKGKIMVRFNITPAGRAGDVRIEENTLGSPEVASCITGLMRSWIFPFKPPDEVPVQYPFLFTSAG
ncbi:MAG TPA: AgmX/PglI C-terminal domain-containing protein [Myxococcaceae bacterium]|nr:AgmX/PglI C-terminal domain-containing protein [Myxococcaceae bacterium]